MQHILLRLVICEPTTLGTGCWVWPGASSDNGYGVARHEGKQGRVHRLVYEHFVGIIPADLVLDHRCHTRKCANFEHLELVTRSENRLREGLRDRELCRRGHRLADVGIYASPGGISYCRACGRENWHNWNKRKQRGRLE